MAVTTEHHDQIDQHDQDSELGESLRSAWAEPVEPTGFAADDDTGHDDDAERLGEELDDAPVYPDVTAWVEDFFSQVFWRDLEGPQVTWCPQWWRHAEVVYRLEALWRSWEHLRRDPALGAATWTIQHLDHHLPILLSSDGPMHGCTAKRGHRHQPRELPTSSPYGT